MNNNVLTEIYHLKIAINYEDILTLVNKSYQFHDLIQQCINLNAVKH